MYHTVLTDARHDFVRMDVCDKCWTEQYTESRDRKGFISCWQGQYEAPPAAPVEAIQRENAETLLRKLIELNDPKYAAASFILAVMLERKRLLKVKEHLRSEGKRIFVYEHPKTGDVFTIPDPELQLNQLNAVQHDVANLLEHGLPTEQQAASTNEVPAPAENAEIAAADTPAAVVEPAAT